MNIYVPEPVTLLLVVLSFLAGFLYRQYNDKEQIADALSSQAEEILRAAEERGEELDIDKVLDKVFEMGSIRDLLKQHLEIFVRDLM